MSFLAHLYNEMVLSCISRFCFLVIYLTCVDIQVITSSVVFGCANRVLDGATPEFVVSVQHLLGAAERHLLCDDQVCIERCMPAMQSCNVLRDAFL